MIVGYWKILHRKDVHPSTCWGLKHHRPWYDGFFLSAQYFWRFRSSAFSGVPKRAATGHERTGENKENNSSVIFYSLFVTMMIFHHGSQDYCLSSLMIRHSSYSIYHRPQPSNEQTNQATNHPTSQPAIHPPTNPANQPTTTVDTLQPHLWKLSRKQSRPIF